MINIFLIISSIYLLWRSNLSQSIYSLKHNVAQHLFLASCVTITVLATLKAGTFPNMPLHFLGLTFSTLLIGFKLTLIACVLSSLFLLLTGFIPLSSYGVFLGGGMLVSVLSIEFVRQKLAKHHLKKWHFIALFSILGSIVSLGVKTLLLAIYFVINDNMSFIQVFDNYLLLSLLFWLPEIMLNGTIIMTLTQHKPHWLANKVNQPSN